MNVEIKLDPNQKEPKIILIANSLSNEIQAIVRGIEEMESSFITVRQEDNIYLLEPKTIALIRVEDNKIVAYNNHGQAYIVPKRLYEIEQQKLHNFLRISKSVIVNLKEIDHVTPSLDGFLLLIMKNGMEEYISRHYLANFKKKLGL